MTDEVVAAVKAGENGHPADGHGLRALRRRISRRTGPALVHAQAAPRDDADGDARRRSRGDPRRHPGTARARRRHGAGAASRSLHARATEPGPALPLAERYAAGHDRSSRPRSPRGVRRVVLERVGVVAATSANVHGAPDPARIDEVPAEIRDAVAAILDTGTLPGTPSTVIDPTGREPQVLRGGRGGRRRGAREDRAGRGRVERHRHDHRRAPLQGGAGRERGGVSARPTPSAGSRSESVPNAVIASGRRRADRRTRGRAERARRRRGGQ